MTKVGGGDIGARLTVVEGVALHEMCAGETTNECRDTRWGGESCHSTRGRSETEHDCGTSAYCGTYYNMTRTENEKA